MDCDDQVRLVKGQDDPDADTVDVAYEARPPVFIGICVQGLAMTRSTFGIGNLQLASPIFACRV